MKIGTMSPAEIGILLHYHCSMDDWKHPVSGYTLGDTYPSDGPHETFLYDTVVRFKTLGLLEFSGGASGARRYNPTPKLHAYVELLCQMPLPEQVWVHPDRVYFNGGTPMLKTVTAENQPA